MVASPASQKYLGISDCPSRTKRLIGRFMLRLRASSPNQLSYAPCLRRSVYKPQIICISFPSSPRQRVTFTQNFPSCPDMRFRASLSPQNPHESSKCFAEPTESYGNALYVAHRRKAPGMWRLNALTQFVWSCVFHSRQMSSHTHTCAFLKRPDHKGHGGN